MAASIGLIPGNLLSYADQDFESGTFGWTGGSAWSLALSGSQAFNGTSSLAATCNVSSTSGFPTSPAVRVSPGLIHCFACMNVPRNMQLTMTSEVDVYEANGTFYTRYTGLNVNNVLAYAGTWVMVDCYMVVPDIPVAAGKGAWLELTMQPIVAATGPVWLEPVSGDVIYLDYAFIGVTSGTQVLVDWNNPAFGADATAGNTWTDISPWVRDDTPVNLTHGRQDTMSQVQAGTASFTVDNSTGLFTPETSVWDVRPGCRVQINRYTPDKSYEKFTRFDGQILGFDADPSVTGNENNVSVSCSDVMGALTRQPDLQSWTVEYIRRNNPGWLFCLDEAEQNDATPVSDTSGNNVAPLSPRFSGWPVYPASGFTAATATPVVQYAGGNTPLEAQTPAGKYNGTYSLSTYGVSSNVSSIYFGATVNATSLTSTQYGASAQFEGRIPDVSVDDSWGLHLWVWPDVTVQNFQYLNYGLTAVCLSNSRTGQALTVEFNPDVGGINGGYYLSYYSNIKARGATATSSASQTWQPGSIAANGPQHIMVNSAKTPGNNVLNMYVKNAQQSQTSPTAGVTVPAGVTFDTLTIGGRTGGGNGWIGNISTVAMLPIPMDGSSYDLIINNIMTLGMYGLYGKSIGAGAQLTLPLFANLPPYWTGTFDTCQADQDYTDLSGQNVISEFQTLASMAKADLFVDSAGKLQLHGRDRRMGASSILTLPEGSYSADIAPRWNDQNLVNYEVLASVQRPAGTTVVAQNPDSISRHGVYANGSVQSPATAPYSVLAPHFTALNVYSPSQTIDSVVVSPSQPMDIANWDVAVNGEESMKLSTLKVDVLSNLQGGQEYVAPSSVYGPDVGSLITVNEGLEWWPSDPLADLLFVEGVTETYSLDEESVTFYTSPASQWLAWQPGSNITGVLDSESAIIGISDNPDCDSVYQLPQVSAGMFTATQNLENGQNGFVGRADIGALSTAVNTMLNPPICVVQQTTAQSISAGTQGTATGQIIYWDRTLIDTYSGMNFNQYALNEYIVQLEGWYEINCTVQFAANTSSLRQVLIAHIQSGQTTFMPRYPTAYGRSAASVAIGVTATAVVYAYAGDAFAVYGFQNSGSALNTVTTNGGSLMSVRWIGYGTARF
jgi:hypothetical protein